MARVYPPTVMRTHAYTDPQTSTQHFTGTHSPACMQSEDGTMGRDFERANLATAEITEDNNLLFEGALFTRNAIAEVRAGWRCCSRRGWCGGEAWRGMASGRCTVSTKQQVV